MRRKAVRRWLTALMWGAALTLCACGTEAPEPSALRLALNWFPEAEHGGFYAAQVHGLYAERDLQVEILAGGPDAPVVQRVATGQVTFGLANADGVVNARAAGAPIVAVLAPYQVNPRCIVVHESTGITRIDQIAGLTLALSQRPAFSHYLRHRFAFPEVDIVPYHGSVTPFLHDQSYAMQGYLFSEPVVARRLGADARALLVADTGFNPYASVLIATEQTLSEHPGLVASMVDASVAGWHRYLDAPEATNRHIQQLNPEMDIEVLRAGARLSHELVLDAEALRHGLGTMSAARWQRLIAQMEEAGVVGQGRVRADACFTSRFLPASADLE